SVNNRLMTFTGLKPNTQYNVAVFGLKEGKAFELFYRANLFETLKQGDEADYPLTVSTVEEFLAMDARKHYKLENDLDFEGASITPLFTSGTPFNGSFDGSDFTIKNMNIT